jgi:hypothetical protein
MASDLSPSTTSCLFNFALRSNTWITPLRFWWSRTCHNIHASHLRDLVFEASPRHRLFRHNVCEFFTALSSSLILLQLPFTSFPVFVHSRSSVQSDVNRMSLITHVLLKQSMNIYSHLCCVTVLIWSRNSLAGIATCYRPDGTPFELQWSQEILPELKSLTFTRTFSVLTLYLTQHTFLEAASVLTR